MESPSASNMMIDKDKKTVEKSPRSLDQALRPVSWEEYVGQEGIKENLRILLTAAKGRNHQPEHVLLYGPPGLGPSIRKYGAWRKTVS